MVLPLGPAPALTALVSPLRALSPRGPKALEPREARAGLPDRACALPWPTHQRRYSFTPRCVQCGVGPRLLPAVSAGVSSGMASAATRGPAPGPVHALAKTQASHLCRYKRENVNWFWTVKSATWNWAPYLKTYGSRMASARECCGAVVPHFPRFLSGSSPFLDVFQEASGN